MLHVYGDSSMIINWSNGTSSLSSLDLEAWCKNIIDLKAFFLSIDYQHVYREYIVRAYILSKEALQLATRLLSFMEYYEGIVIGEDSIQLF